MRTAESWVSVISPAAHLGVAGELERQIKRIQLDALLEASEIAMRSVDESPDYKCYRGGVLVYDAILTRAKEVEGK